MKQYIYIYSNPNSRQVTQPLTTAVLVVFEPSCCLAMCGSARIHGAAAAGFVKDRCGYMMTVNAPHLVSTQVPRHGTRIRLVYNSTGAAVAVHLRSIP